MSKYCQKNIKLQKNNNLHPFIFSKIQKSSLYGLWSLRSSFKKLLFSLFSKTVQNRKNFNVCVFSQGYCQKILEKHSKLVQNQKKSVQVQPSTSHVRINVCTVPYGQKNLQKPSTKIVKIKISNKKTGNSLVF